jgi:hypothetical protein
MTNFYLAFDIYLIILEQVHKIVMLGLRLCYLVIVDKCFIRSTFLNDLQLIYH